MATIIDIIPVELLTGICQYLSAHDLARLALTSTSLQSIVQPVLYHHVQVSDDAAAEQFYCRILRPSYVSLLGGVAIARPTSFELFMNTLPHLSSIVRSLEITEQYKEVPRADIKTLLLSMPRLTRLTLHCGLIEDLDEFSLSISPHLNEFTSCSVEIGASFFRFLDSHPEITVWRHGVRNDALLHLDIPDASSDRLSRLRTYETASFHLPLEHARMVSCMTSLTRLSIRYDCLVKTVNSSLRDPAALRSFEDMFSRCGTNLTTLSLYGPSVHNNDNPLPSILTKILRHSPVLRRLNVTHVQHVSAEVGAGYGSMRYDPIETMDPDMFKDVSIPPPLEILTWDLRLIPDPCPYIILGRSEIDGLTAAGLANAKLLFSVISSLATLFYVEDGSFHVFRRARDGDVTYAGKDDVEELYDRWWVQVHGYYNRRD